MKDWTRIFAALSLSGPEPSRNFVLHERFYRRKPGKNRPLFRRFYSAMEEPDEEYPFVLTTGKGTKRIIRIPKPAIIRKAVRLSRRMKQSIFIPMTPRVSAEDGNGDSVVTARFSPGACQSNR